MRLHLKRLALLFRLLLPLIDGVVGAEEVNLEGFRKGLSLRRIFKDAPRIQTRLLVIGDLDRALRHDL